MLGYRRVKLDSKKPRGESFERVARATQEAVTVFRESWTNDLIMPQPVSRRRSSSTVSTSCFGSYGSVKVNQADGVKILVLANQHIDGSRVHKSDKARVG